MTANSHNYKKKNLNSDGFLSLLFNNGLATEQKQNKYLRIDLRFSSLNEGLFVCGCIINLEEKKKGSTICLFKYNDRICLV